jgi:alanyl-tRNA synthetase
LIHTALAVAVRKLPGLSVEAADISGDATDSLIVASWSSAVRTEHVAEIDAEVRGIVLQSRPVTFEKAKSLDHARDRHGALFRLSDRHQLSGRVRLVVIDDLDANPCSGTHFDTTGIGPYEMLRQTDGYRTNQFAIRLRRTGCWMYWYGPGKRYPA